MITNTREKQQGMKQTEIHACTCTHRTHARTHAYSQPHPLSTHTHTHTHTHTVYEWECQRECVKESVRERERERLFIRVCTLCFWILKKCVHAAIRVFLCVHACAVSWRMLHCMLLFRIQTREWRSACSAGQVRALGLVVIKTWPSAVEWHHGNSCHSVTFVWGPQR